MPLLTIADLDQPQEVLAPLIKKAQTLSGIYMEFVKDDSESFQYGVFDGGDEERAYGIHASEISNCMRVSVYSLMHTPKVHNPNARNMKMRFRIGTAVHALIQSEWKRIGIRSKGRIHVEIEAEVAPELQEVAAEWDLHSHCDMVLTLFEDDRPIVRVGTEIKTKSGPSYDLLKKPESAHLEQTTVYMAALDLPLMWTLYYNKSNSSITTSYPPYLFRFNAGLWERLQMRFAKMHYLAQHKRIPEREEGFHCTWCPYWKTCKPKTLERKKKRNQSTRVQVSSSMMPKGKI